MPPPLIHTQSGHAGSPSLKFTQCPLANVSYCPITQESEAFTVVLYNPLSRARADTVTLPVSVANVVVTDGSGATVSSTVFTNTLPGA
ncbi:MAG: hypothetical protein P4L40_01385 [Terracidiphilus sp.]|nr:hypothetical protein [Terracidiphilus sp.]